jgi:hypothetical protein
MIGFFEENHRLGIVHAVTTPPRSKRNLDRHHVMDIVAERVAEELDCPFVRMFDPSTKSTRGRHAKHAELVIKREVRDYVGKVL